MADSLWVVIPVKMLSLGKQRLAQCLDENQRRALAQAMLQDMLIALSGCRSVSRIVLVSKDQQVQALAGQYAADILPEPADCSSLNDAVRFALLQAQQQQVASVLILHGDIPLIQPQDIEQILQQQQHHAVCLMPDCNDNGTNGLLLQLPSCFEVAYGEQSFTRHRQQAEAKGLSCCTIRTAATLQLDVDEPSDLLALHDKLDDQSCTGQLIRSESWQNALMLVAQS